jgi:hypothetical protein
VGEAGASRTIDYDHAFVLIGSDVPVVFLKSIGIRMENEWEGSLLRSLLLSFTTLLGLWLAGGQTGLVSDGSVETFALTGWMVTILSLGALTFFGR